METCSRCHRQFASFDVLQRHQPQGRCLSVASLRARGIVKDSTGVWHRPKTGQVQLPGVIPPGRPSAETSRSVPAATTVGGAQDRGPHNDAQDAL